MIPDDYPTIKDGIINASTRDTIFVRNGLYPEDIIINKEKINLIGENKIKTIIDGGLNSKNTISVNAKDVLIKNFMIINGDG